MGQDGFDHTGDPSCPVCGGDCTAFPDLEVHDRYPFLSEEHKAEMNRKAREREAKTPPAREPRRRGRRAKHGPAEDRARKPSEDR